MSAFARPKEPEGQFWTVGERETDRGACIFGEFSITHLDALDDLVRQIKRFRNRLKSQGDKK